MSHTPHELAEAFPGQEERIRALKTCDAHFARLADRYDEINEAIHRAETGIAPTDGTHETDLRRARLRLLDDISRMLRTAA